MNESKIAVRYSKALFEYADEMNKLDIIKKDIDFIQSVCKVNEFDELLNNPIIQPSQKRKIIHSVIKQNISKDTFKFIDLITKNRREKYLPNISRRFIADYYINKNIKPAVLTTSIKIEEELREKIISIIKSVYKTDVIVEDRIEPSIIGGFVLTVEDQQYDASVASKLKDFNYKLVHQTFKKVE
ncbi:ATP synthase F1 subunit delta [Bacteroidota bacterium]